MRSKPFFWKEPGRWTKCKTSSSPISIIGPTGVRITVHSSPVPRTAVTVRVISSPCRGVGPTQSQTTGIAGRRPDTVANPRPGPGPIVPPEEWRGASRARRTPRSPARNASGSPRARIRTYATVQGPIPGTCQQPDARPRLGRHQARGRCRPPAGARRRAEAPAPGPPAWEARRRESGDHGRRGKRPGHASPPPSARVARRRRPSGRHRPRPATLTCWPITARTTSSSPSTWPGCAVPAGRRHRGPNRVATEHLDHGGGIGVEVEEVAQALGRHRQVAEILQLQDAAQRSVAAVEQGGDPRPVGKIERPAVGRAVTFLHAGHGPGGEELEQRRRGKGGR